MTFHIQLVQMFLLMIKYYSRLRGKGHYQAVCCMSRPFSPKIKVNAKTMFPVKPQECFGGIKGYG